MESSFSWKHPNLSVFLPNLLSKFITSESGELTIWGTCVIDFHSFHSSALLLGMLDLECGLWTWNFNGIIVKTVLFVIRPGAYLIKFYANFALTFKIMFTLSDFIKAFNAYCLYYLQLEKTKKCGEKK